MKEIQTIKQILETEEARRSDLPGIWLFMEMMKRNKIVKQNVKNDHGKQSNPGGPGR